MPAHNRAILADIQDKNLNPKKLHVVGKDGHLTSTKKQVDVNAALLQADLESNTSTNELDTSLEKSQVSFSNNVELDVETKSLLQIEESSNQKEELPLTAAEESLGVDKSKSNKFKPKKK